MWKQFYCTQVSAVPVNFFCPYKHYNKLSYANQLVSYEFRAIQLIS